MRQASLLLVALLAALGGAQAQEGHDAHDAHGAHDAHAAPAVVSWGAFPEAFDLPAGRSTSLVTLTNPGGAEELAELSLALPAGWTGAIEPAWLPLAAGASATVELQIETDGTAGVAELHVRTPAGVLAVPLRAPAAPPSSEVAPSAAPSVGAAPSAAIATVALGVGATALCATWAWRRWPGLGLLPLYARLAPRRALEHPRRAAMLQLARDEPGLPLREAQRRLGLANGAMRHHLRLLEAAGLVCVVSDGQLRRLYATGTQRAQPVAPLGERAIAVLRERGPMPAHALADALGVSRQALHYHVRRLQTEGRVATRLQDGERLLAAAAS